MTMPDPAPNKKPHNVLWFEVLLYLSLTLDALSTAFQDRTPSFEVTETIISIGTILTGVMILLLTYFVYLAAQQRKDWPRWVLIVCLVLSALSLTQELGNDGLQLSSAIEVLSCALTAAGLYFSYTGDARGWFNA